MSDRAFNKIHGQDAIERIILRRLHEGRIDGYTLEMANEIARAAIEAFREPTQAMVESAARAISLRSINNNGMPWPIGMCREDARVALEAAFVAALQPATDTGEAK
jgi:hypothetical protein